MAFLLQNAEELLGRAHRNGRLAHAYLITGPRGSGKRVLAERVAKLVNPNGTGEVRWVEPESKSRRIVVEQVRELEHELHMRAMMGGVKVGIIVDADRLVPAAANAFLKTLEEPPGNSLILLLSAKPEELLETVLSRCIEVPLRLDRALALSEPQQALAAELAEFSISKHRDIPAVFRLARRFAQLLAEAKERISDELEAERKSEEARYKQTTDSRAWLEDREDYFKALTEARYAGEREQLLEVFLQWWGDVLRHQNGSQSLDLADSAEATALMAAEFTPEEAIRRLGAIEEMRENTGRAGVQEQLAIEVGLMKAFGQAPK